MRRRVAKMNANGFSLIELVAAVAILGILTAIAIPKYNQLQHDAAISRAKDLLANIIKECIFVDTLNGGAKVGDLRSTGYGSKNSPGGHRLGINWRNTTCGFNCGWVLDTDLNSQIPLEPQHSCFQVAAKSGTSHFMIKYDMTTKKIERDCRIDAGETMYQPYHCDPSRPAGQHW